MAQTKTYTGGCQCRATMASHRTESWLDLNIHLTCTPLGCRNAAPTPAFHTPNSTGTRPWESHQTRRDAEVTQAAVPRERGNFFGRCWSRISGCRNTRNPG